MIAKPDATTSSVKSDIEFLLQVNAVHEKLLDTLDYAKVESIQEDTKALNLYLSEEVEKAIRKMDLPQGKSFVKKLTEAVIDEVVGFGPIEPLLKSDTITDIFINGPTDIFVERRGRVEKVSTRFIDHEHILRLVQRVASKSGRHLDLSTPYFDAQLADGSRIHAIIPPVAIDGIKVSLRKYGFSKFSLKGLIDVESLTPTMAEFLQIAVEARMNIAICGGTGSGKTTLLNSLLASVGSGERMVTIEDTPELEPQHYHTVRLLTRLPNPEGKGAVTQADLMINALRMRPDRVILGELRGQEAFNLLHAMNTGQDGSMVTLHASGPEEVVSRLLNMILMARYALSSESVIQQIAIALDLIIYVTRLVDGSRRVMAISQVLPSETAEIGIEEIFRYDIKKITADELKGKFVQLPTPPTQKMLNKLTVSGLVERYKALFSKK